MVQKRKGRIVAKVQRSGPPAAKKPGSSGAKRKTATVTGHSAVQKYKQFFQIDSSGTLKVDKAAVNRAKDAAKSAAKRPSAKMKSAGPPMGGGGGGGGGGPESWRNDPNDSRNHPDPSIIEEQNRLRNEANVPQNQQNMMMMPQNHHQQNVMHQNYAQNMFGAPMQPAPGMDYNAYGMIEYEPAQPDYYGAAPPGAPPQRGQPGWRAPDQNQLGVVSPNEFVDTQATTTEPQDGVLGFFSTLSTEEMIALACGGAGFLLFIIVIIVIIFKLRKKSKRKKKKTAERSDWVNRANSNASSPPAGFMQQQNYRTLPGDKDPDHIARIQARNLPAPPLSYTQSGGVTGMTTASGTYMSDERPSMRHKD